MPGAGLHHLRIICIGHDVGLWPRRPHGMERDTPPIIEQDDSAPPLDAGLPRRIGARRLYPEPGQQVVVAWGDARDLLAGQLAHPERLRDAHRLRCHAQVYEALAPQRREMLATTMLGDASLAAMLQPLTDGLAARLGLAATLPQSAARPPQRREPGIVLAGDRLIRLLVAGDPTRDGPAAAGETRDGVPPRPVAAQPAAPPRPTTGPARRAVIPEQYLQPWELRRSREDAIYEMHFTADAGWWRRILRWLCGRSVARQEFLRWQIMLSGKTIEGQLWGVRPPAGGLRHPKVRDWAARTLALAGYDPGLMLTEWEIYWRRKAD
jgi:hypothetical protein